MIHLMQEAKAKAKAEPRPPPAAPCSRAPGEGAALTAPRSLQLRDAFPAAGSPPPPLPGMSAKPRSRRPRGVALHHHHHHQVSLRGQSQDSPGGPAAPRRSLTHRPSSSPCLPCPAQPIPAARSRRLKQPPAALLLEGTRR